MTTSTEAGDPRDATMPPLPDPEGNPGKGFIGRNLYRGLVALGVASAMLWLGAILISALGYNQKANDYLEDRTFPEAAEPICAAAVDDLERLPPADQSPTPAARVAVIEQSTDRLETMLDDLRGIVPETADAKWINLWIDDWHIHLDDRRDFAERLSRPGGEREEFLETPKYGKQISRTVSQFAEVNEMTSCVVPNDV